MAFSARAPESGDALARLSWQDFEHLLAEHYREQGYRVELVAAHDLKALGNAGLDMRLHRGSETVIVQCGHWDAIFVDVAEANQLMSAMLNEAASRGVLVTRGTFTAAAKAAVRRQPRVHLVDGDLLRAMLKLPDHLDTAPAGTRPAEKVARTAAAARRRSGSDRSYTLPAVIGVVIVGLLGFFVWRAMSRHDDTPPPVAATPAASAPVAVAPPAALPPTTVPRVPVTAAQAAPRQPEASDGLARELAERERARREEEAAAGRKKSEDALKVMERNTREVGSY
ncbi:restriction endonuclease [Luteibacter aegosomatissinici]|uniref:restriction endonuclease n=1 Tax=Luteibacter aegosomatissinici TaxID=2911539 RepID=UPI001FFA087C|nr:restriction endonuclease [Luteibacter aegosomatissinici]UPG92893.1 restriction endonuclease [Luteibacter aegosomatissinici]